MPDVICPTCGLGGLKYSLLWLLFPLAGSIVFGTKLQWEALSNKTFSKLTISLSCYGDFSEKNVA